MKQYRFQKAFSMLTAIVIIVLMSTVAMFVMSFSAKTVKSTTVQYQHEQAELYAKSYTEYAVMAVTANDRSINCLEDITGNIGSNPSQGKGYRVRTHIAYIANHNEVDISTCSPIRILSGAVQTVSTPLSIVIDVYVDYKDLDNINGPWLTVHRRSIQKI